MSSALETKLKEIANNPDIDEWPTDVLTKALRKAIEQRNKYIEAVREERGIGFVFESNDDAVLLVILEGK